jgi:preprotein translocase subunit SecY
MASGSSGGLGIEEFIDFFAGGAFKNFSVFMLTIMPYISASIIIQLLTIVFPKLKKIQEEEGGKKKIKAWTRYGTVLICLIQSYTVVTYANSIPDAINIARVPFAVLAMLTTTTGTMFLMWIGDQITRRGIGNGISVIIFAGIVARIPGALWTLVQKIQDKSLNPVYVIIALLMFVVVVALVIMEQQGQRKIPVHYAKRVIGRRIYGAQNTYLPFKVNPWLSKLSSFLDPNKLPYIISYAVLIIFFAYFYTQVTLNPVEIAKHIRENGGSIPGIRSEKMEEYLQRILFRIILPGSLFLAFIAIIPTVVQVLFKFPSSIAYLMGGTSLLILVGVDLDTMSQIEGYLRMHHHEGIVRKGKIRSRNL